VTASIPQPPKRIQLHFDVSTEDQPQELSAAWQEIASGRRSGSTQYWAEFVFEGYVNHRPGAIFLKGLPDVPESRPHSREYVRHADGH
jgi:hypothetical protein